MIPLGLLVGFIAWFVYKYLISGFFTVNQNERAVKTVFGKAERLTREEEASGGFYDYPSVRLIQPGGPYWKWPWEEIHKVVISTQAQDIFHGGGKNDRTLGLEAVTKDQLNTGLKGQIRWHISQKNIYAYLFGIKAPIEHVMGYFISVLRERIANFEAPKGGDGAVSGISINDLRKNLNAINLEMERECRDAEEKYGVVLEASLVTEIDPPREVESALAAINTTHNQVSSDISLAHAAADQKIVQSRRAVEIETLKANAEVQPLLALAAQLSELKKFGQGALEAYVRNVKLAVFSAARLIIKKTHQ